MPADRWSKLPANLAEAERRKRLAEVVAELMRARLRQRDARKAAREATREVLELEQRLYDELLRLEGPRLVEPPAEPPLDDDVPW